MLDISELWESARHKDWKDALELYWKYIPERLRKIEIEFDENKINVSEIERFEPREWYRFLYDKYFVWKYSQLNILSANRGRLKKAYKNEKGGLKELAKIKSKIFEFNKDDTKKGLEIVTEIHGLSIKGGSGLLAVLFPRYFATVDRYLIKAIRRIESLKSDYKIQGMEPCSISKKEGIYLINMMRKKAGYLNKRFSTGLWTPRKVDKILWAYGHERPGAC